MSTMTRVVTQRNDIPDLVAAADIIHTRFGNDLTISVYPDVQPLAYRVVRTSTNTAFTADEIAALRSAIETAPTLTPQREAQYQIDAMPLMLKATFLVLLEQLNVLRVRAGLSEVSVATALAAIRAKAATL